MCKAQIYINHIIFASHQSYKEPTICCTVYNFLCNYYFISWYLIVVQLFNVIHKKCKIESMKWTIIIINIVNKPIENSLNGFN